ncbi:MAG: DUF1501 domain-containing protein [Planctomycetes bacterium]|nr:DUF1501 domain-containing protein [Planctomycetota bacterium]
MPTRSGCHQFEQVDRITRRQAIAIGSAAGLSLPNLLRIREAVGKESKGSFGSAKSVIFLFLHGGHPQHETFDPKPTAPAEVRGEFGDIATALPGIRFSELLPECAKIADRLTLVRSMTHGNTNHVQACLPAMTGHKHPSDVSSRGDFPPSMTDFPHFGAVVDHVKPNAKKLPTWVQLGPVMTRNNGTVLHGQSPGFLGNDHSPLMVNQDLLIDRVKIDAVTPMIGVDRMRGRQRLLAEVESQRRILDRAGANSKDVYYQRAYHLLTSDATQRAFDLDSEPSKSRERYPRSQVGQSCLLARRLVEAGVPFVNVHWCKTPNGSWDTHSQNFKKMKQSLGPTLDQSLAALILDLEERRLLDDVLVVAMAEFGRTPKINKNAGRDHWPYVYSLALAGAGLRRGVVIGASERQAAYPQSDPHDPADMAATIYHLLGIPHDTLLVDRERRPHKLIVGRPIDSMLT